jgi:hypothetical protein
LDIYRQWRILHELAYSKGGGGTQTCSAMLLAVYLLQEYQYGNNEQFNGTTWTGGTK